VVRYADDFVILHEEREVIEQCREVAAQWLGKIGLELNEKKTRITHTLETMDGEAGFDFLGFRIRQYPAGKYNSDRNGQGQPVGCITRIEPSPKAIKRHTEKLRETIKRHIARKESELIEALNPQVAGWANYYRHVVGHIAFRKLGATLFAMLYAWAKRRHPKKSKGWIVRKYWHVSGGWKFRAPNGVRLRLHEETHYESYVQVAGVRSPYDGDLLYWSTRLGYHPKVPPRVAKLLKRQKGRCRECGQWFREEEAMEVDLLIPRSRGGTSAFHNLQLLHDHCRYLKTVAETNCHDGRA
jgi:RNA-directed DNA polymerase